MLPIMTLEAPAANALEISPEKKIVWALRSWAPPADLGPSTTIQILDAPGAAANGDLPR